MRFDRCQPAFEASDERVWFDAALVVKPATLLVDAALLLETNQRGLPVIDGEGMLVGVISEGDFLHRAEVGIEPPPGNWLEEMLGIKEDTGPSSHAGAVGTRGDDVGSSLR